MDPIGQKFKGSDNAKIGISCMILPIPSMTVVEDVTDNILIIVRIAIWIMNEGVYDLVSLSIMSSNFYLRNFKLKISYNA